MPTLEAGYGFHTNSAHLVRTHPAAQDAFIEAMSEALDRRFGINHATLQIEHGAACARNLHAAAPQHHD